MENLRFFDRLGRKIIITGHYGSGKTEFAVSSALRLSESIRISIIDLDIVNPYFRSREQRELLESKGIGVYGSTYDTEITAELPALGASIRKPLESKTCRVIIDVGGNETGALVLNQFSKYFGDDETTVLAVINANRPDTGNAENAISHIKAIEDITNLNVSYIVNNTHMLRETTADDIIRGYRLCKEISKMTGINFLCSCYPEKIISPNELRAIPELNENLMPLGMYMRPTWL